MASNKKYWKSVEELKENSSIVKTLQQKEFVEEIPVDEFLGNKENLESSSTTRRDFLKYVGFTTAAASLAACEGPVMKTIPYVVAPDEIIPGEANYYASTIADGFDFANVLVKTREGRPIKIERNTLSKYGNSVNARVQASVLSLYDSNRLTGPVVNGEETTWENFDTQVSSALQTLEGKNIVLLTQTFASPSTAKLIKEFTTKYPTIKHVVYDTVSCSEALDAYQAKFGTRALPDYDFSKAEVIISVGADILGDWQGGGYEASYAKSRVPSNGKMSHHIQFEANMTRSGAKADIRVPASPSQQAKILEALTGGGTSGLPENIAIAVSKAKAKLQKAGNKAVIVTGLPTLSAQTKTLDFNQQIGSVVLDVEKPRLTRMGNAIEVKNVIDDVLSGKIQGLITVGVDPVYSFPSSEAFSEAYQKLDFTLAFSMKMDATASLAKYVAATPHYLESWGDAQFKKGEFSLMQPTITPLFDTRQFQDTLLKWLGQDKTYYDYIKENWTSSILPGSSWNQALHDGVFASTVEVETEASATKGEATLENSTSHGALLNNVTEGGYELTLYTKASMGDGQQANNPWLQEMPDPITRTTWDNYLTMSAADAKDLGVRNWHSSNGALNGNYVNITVGNNVLEKVPVIIQPGQAKGTVGLALGYGKIAAIQKEMQTGVNAFKIYSNFSSVQNVQIEKTTGEHHFASVQMQKTMAGRSDDIIRETTLEIFNTKDAHYWNPVPEVAKGMEEVSIRSQDADLWAPFDDTVGHHFNLSIDLNACTGCGACVIACHAENNVPVVGKREVRKFRDMHWLRVDRYYSSAETFKQEIKDLKELPAFESYEKVELAYQENPEVAFQPVMCQHCNHAPCETVCPVAATSHGRQGQNHMAYNRCVGTRYCANNCPYKVRRFNWFLYSENDEFDFNMNNDLGRMVLNPDVVVRSRGVMEKCSMCIQMTQKTILDAKREGRAVKDDEFKTACSAACNTGAMVFGDVNNHNSEVAKLKKDKRMYYLLEEVGTKPNVFYHVNVKNIEEV